MQLNARVTGGRLRALLDGLGAILCAAMLVTAFVLAAVAAPPHPGAPLPAVDLSGLEPPGDSTDPGVRALPLLDPAGPVVASFPDGAGLEDPERVQVVLRVLAGRLGIDGALDTLLTTSLDDPDGGPEDDLDLYHGYPYEYVTLDPVVDAWLTPDAVQADPAAVVDLAGLLLLDATRSAREADEDHPVNSWAGVAYSLLRRARDIAASCDVQLQLTFVLSMGYAPHIEDVEEEAAEAVDACPGDPTPLWLLGQVQSGQASLIESFFKFERGPRAMAAAAEHTFATLRHDYPDSPLGWAGAGDLHLQLAEEAGRLGIEPFQVRAWQRSALEEYAGARRRSGDPALLLGWGRALSANGRDDEAVDALEDLEKRMSWEPVHQEVLDRVLARAGRPGEVVADIEATPRFDRPFMASLSLSPRRVGVGEPQSPNFGFGGSRAGAAYDQSQKYDAGSSVQDLGFVPVSNGTWDEPWCRAGAYLVALIEDGRADDAWELVSQGVDPESWDGNSVDCRGAPLRPYSTSQAGFTDSSSALGRIGLVAALETGDADLRADALSRSDDGYTSQDALLSQALDAQSDFWRAAGDLDRAAEVVAAWREELPDDPWASHRAGELAFLAGDYDEAAADYQRAVSLFPTGGEYGDTAYGDHGLGPQYVDDLDGRSASELELGAAQELGGHPDDAGTTYRALLAELGSREYTDYATELTFYAHSQLGSMLLGQDDLDGAAEQLRAALDLEYADEPPPGPGDEVGWGRQATQLSSGAQDNNLALALAKLGRGDEAVTYAESARAHDLANPVFVDAVAFAQHLAGHEHEAAEAYRAALDADPTSYVSANNLAVLLAQGGDRHDAAAVLRDALRVAPDYAIGWHNLGVVEAPVSSRLLPSQGSLERAGSLDRDLRGRDDLIVDKQIYDSGLDVSKPLPPDWTYAASASSSTSRITLSVILLLLLRVLWALGLDKIVSLVGERVVRRPGRRLAPEWAVLACLGVVGWPLYRAGHSALERGVLLGAGAALVLLPLLLRRLVRALTHVPARHHTWAPAVALGVLAAPFGLVLAPYPFLEGGPAGHRDTPRVRRLRALVPVVVATVAVAFLALAWLAPTPMARTLAVSSSALLGAVLAPVPPLDGSHFTGRLLNLVVTVGLAGVTAVFALNWV
jgi:tetratricopeptide (TPR) repeat protein